MKPIQGSRFVIWVCILTIQSIFFGSSCSYNAHVSSVTIPPATGSTSTTTINSLEAISSLSSTTGEGSLENVVAIDLKAARLQEEDVTTLTTLLLRPRQPIIHPSDDSTNAAAATGSTSIQSLSMKECLLSRKHMTCLLSSALLKGSDVATLSIHNR